MYKSLEKLSEKKLVGLSIRTNNAEIFASDPSTNKISLTIQKYFQNGLAETIKNRKNPGINFCAYTNYENDFQGDYTFFIGEEVASFDGVSENLETHIIPAQTYTKFTSDKGIMPDVCINMWQKIWQMPISDLGGERAYRTDFEIYDERALDPQQTILDIFIGLKE